MEFVPFLVTNLALGVNLFLVLATSAIVLLIPVFATRGKAQAIWLAVVGFVLTVEFAGLIAVGILNQQGKLWN
jgi:hypothetical protein